VAFAAAAAADATAAAVAAAATAAACSLLVCFGLFSVAVCFGTGDFFPLGCVAAAVVTAGGVTFAVIVFVIRPTSTPVAKATKAPTSGLFFRNLENEMPGGIFSLSLPKKKKVKTDKSEGKRWTQSKVKT